MIEMLSPYYEINVDVPETDVTKIKVGNEAEISLSALGKDTKFEGIVLSIEPSSTNIQDVVYYKVKVGINDERLELFKFGMSADILIKTDSRSNVVFVPSRAILNNSETNEKYVRVLKNDQIEEIIVKTGLKADNSKIEITEGLEGGEDIILKIID